MLTHINGVRSLTSHELLELKETLKITGDKAIEPVVDAARAIAAGDLDTELPHLGSNEFGDVSRRLADMAAHLRAQEAELEAEARDSRAAELRDQARRAEERAPVRLVAL